MQVDDFICNRSDPDLLGRTSCPRMPAVLLKPLIYDRTRCKALKPMMLSCGTIALSNCEHALVDVHDNGP